MTCDEMRKKALRIAEQLQGLGIQPGDRIAIATDSDVHLTAFIVGVLLAGAVCCPVDALSTVGMWPI